jgi:glycosyltransferase involved in cell wall biosynthesis/peptidoglycan/xylan/chitin deacetylase (PgdA/CDA1 family)
VAPPSFSIVVPTFDRRDVVCEAVRAIAQIEYAGPLQLIVVADGSTDGSAEALEAIACPFPKRVLVQPNAGAARARNHGAAQATGDILLFLDDDMMARSDLVQQHALAHATGADVVLGHIPLDPASPAGPLSEAIGQWAEARARELGAREPTMLDFLSGHFSIRRDAFDALGGFDERFTASGTYGNEDLDFGLRLRDRYRTAFSPGAVAHQRYVVSPQRHMRQYFETGQADVAFARKHPRHAAELFADRGAGSARSRVAIQPLASLGWLVKSARWLAIFSVTGAANAPAPIKAVAGRFFFFARSLVYWSGVRAAGGRPRSQRALVLCYHALRDLSDDPVLADYGLTPERFERQLSSLQERGFNFVSPEELAAFLDGQGALPRRATLVTFDDCYAELEEAARAILEPRGIPALAFAVSRAETNAWDHAAGARSLRLLDSGGLRELRSHGVEIGSHSRTHRPLTQVPREQLAEETRGSAADLESIGVPRPRFFAYPHGDYDRDSQAAVRDARFLAAFGLRRARLGRTADRYALPRVEILARDTGWRFWVKTAWPRGSLLLETRHLIVRGRRSVRRRLALSSR